MSERRNSVCLDCKCMRECLVVAGKWVCPECINKRLAAAEAARPKCKWKPDDPYYETACGHLWQFIDGGVGENDTKFCPFCGGEIELPRCHICGDAECDLDRCADCGKEFCCECGSWCGDPDDDPHGDYFCSECIKADEA